MEDANAWLRKTRPPLHNRRLTRKARLDGETAFVPLVDPSVLDGVLWGTHGRVVGNDAAE